MNSRMNVNDNNNRIIGEKMVGGRSEVMRVRLWFAMIGQQEKIQNQQSFVATFFALVSTVWSIAVIRVVKLKHLNENECVKIVLLSLALSFWVCLSALRYWKINKIILQHEIYMYVCVCVVVVAVSVLVSGMFHGEGEGHRCKHFLEGFS